MNVVTHCPTRCCCSWRQVFGISLGCGESRLVCGGPPPRPSRPEILDPFGDERIADGHERQPEAGDEPAGVSLQPAQAAQGRQLPGAAPHHGRGRRGRAGRLRHRDRDRGSLLRGPRDRPGRQEHDPGVLLRPAAGQRGSRPCRGLERVHAVQGRGAGRGHDGRGDRLRLREGRHRGRAQGRRPGRRRPRQGLQQEAGREGRLARPSTQEDGDALLARITPTADAGRRRGRRPRDRGRLRGPGASRRRSSRRSSRTSPRARCWAPTPRRCRSPRWPRASRAPPTSSGCTSSPPWTRCRCWRSSRASRPATRRSTARSTWPG